MERQDRKIYRKNLAKIGSYERIRERPMSSSGLIRADDDDFNVFICVLYLVIFGK